MITLWITYSVLALDAGCIFLFFAFLFGLLGFILLAPVLLQQSLRLGLVGLHLGRLASGRRGLHHFLRSERCHELITTSRLVKSCLLLVALVDICALERLLPVTLLGLERHYLSDAVGSLALG